MSEYQDSSSTVLLANGSERSNLEWLSSLTRVGWAWEFLRRNFSYHADYAASKFETLERWGLQYFEDPALDSRNASVFWRQDACSTVLPVTATPLIRSERALDLESLKCSAKVVANPDSMQADVLFQQDGRFLQIAVEGARALTGMRLSASVVPMPKHAAGRVMALRRFANLVTSSTLQANLYPAERRAPRLIKVLQALDFSLAQRSYRDIAVRLFGEVRVEREWNDPRDHLRDQVRRAVYYGRNLVDGGYRQFLR